jgi:hypothetical protein
MLLFHLSFRFFHGKIDPFLPFHPRNQLLHQGLSFHHGSRWSTSLALGEAGIAATACKSPLGDGSDFSSCSDPLYLRRSL